MACHGRSGAVYPVGSGTARPLREYIETLRDACLLYTSQRDQGIFE